MARKGSSAAKGPSRSRGLVTFWNLATGKTFRKSEVGGLLKKAADLRLSGFGEAAFSSVELIYSRVHANERGSEKPYSKSFAVAGYFRVHPQLTPVPNFSQLHESSSNGGWTKSQTPR
jgi:hypothetical protein